VDFWVDNYKVQGFLNRLLRGPRVVAHVSTWKRDASGAKVKEVAQLDEDQAITLVRGTIQAAYKEGNVVILGRGAQAILKDMPDVLHVRIEAPLSARLQRIQDQEVISLEAAQVIATQRDKAAADYLDRFYGIDWSDPMLYDLVINTRKWGVESAAHLIANAISYLPPAQTPDQGQTNKSR
jgi:cytidylate kinase